MKKWFTVAGDARWSKGESVGVGLGLEFKNVPLSGSALLYKEMVIHTDVFISEEPTIEDRDQSQRSLPNLDFRRMQRNR